MICAPSTDDCRAPPVGFAVVIAALVIVDASRSADVLNEGHSVRADTEGFARARADLKVVVDAFRSLHGNGRLLILPNAWDAASAGLAEAAGAEAVATSSAALAWACGYPDGGFLPPDVLLGAVERIRRVIRVPLSVDVEDGYADDPETVAELVDALVARGAGGINLEDGAGAPELLEAKIRAIKTRLRSKHRDVFINARCDVYLRKLTAKEEALDETLARGRRYAAAGADGFFPPFADSAALATIVERVPLPVNVLTAPALPSLAELRALGVRRLSAGGSIARSMYADADVAIRAFLAAGTYPTAVAPLDLNRLLERPGSP